TVTRLFRPLHIPRLRGLGSHGDGPVTRSLLAPAPDIAKPFLLETGSGHDYYQRYCLAYSDYHPHVWRQQPAGKDLRIPVQRLREDSGYRIFAAGNPHILDISQGLRVLFRGPGGSPWEQRSTDSQPSLDGQR